MATITLNLPADLIQNLELLSAETGRSLEDLVLEGIRLVLSRSLPSAPRSGVFASGQNDVSTRSDELLEGFGDR